MQNLQLHHWGHGFPTAETLVNFTSAWDQLLVKHEFNTSHEGYFFLSEFYEKTKMWLAVSGQQINFWLNLGHKLSLPSKMLP